VLAVDPEMPDKFSIGIFRRSTTKLSKGLQIPCRDLRYQST